MPDSSLSRAAAPRLHPLQLLLPARLHRSVSTAAELPACIRFSCCSPLASASAAALDCVRFNCFRIASASAAASPIQFFSPIASASTAAPRLRPLRLLLPASCSGRFQPCPLFSNILRRVRGSVNRSMKVARHYSLVPPNEHPTSVTHRQTDRHTVKILMY